MGYILSILKVILGLSGFLKDKIPEEHKRFGWLRRTRLLFVVAAFALVGGEIENHWKSDQHAQRRETDSLQIDSLQKTLVTMDQKIDRIAVASQSVLLGLPNSAAVDSLSGLIEALQDNAKEVTPSIWLDTTAHAVVFMPDSGFYINVFGFATSKGLQVPDVFIRMRFDRTLLHVSDEGRFGPNMQFGRRLSIDEDKRGFTLEYRSRTMHGAFGLTVASQKPLSLIDYEVHCCRRR